MAKKKPIKLSKKKCESGLDGMNLTYQIDADGLQDVCLPPEYLRNQKGNTIVKIDCICGKIRVFVNAVQDIRPNNTKPLGIVEAINLEIIRPKVIRFIKEYLQKHLQEKYEDKFVEALKVVSVEVNLTLPCVGHATPSDVIQLIDSALDRTALYRKTKVTSRYSKVNTACLYVKEKQYRLKIYDKTEEQREHGNLFVARKLLRIECVLISRRLVRTFGKENLTLSTILSPDGVYMLCRAYKSIFVEEFIPAIESFLNHAKETLVESFIDRSAGNTILETLACHKELICDIEVLRKALQKWYKLRGVEDRSKQAIYKCRRKDLGLKEDAIRTIRAFHLACG